MTWTDHRPTRAWLFVAVALVVVHKLRLIAWYAIDDAANIADN